MKKHTVKQVIKLENTTEFLTNIKKQRLDRLYSVPLSILTALGIVITGGYFKFGQEDILQLILGASSTLSGGASLAYLFSAKQLRGKLRQKLNSIYDVMGEDFKRNIQNILLMQKFGYESEDRYLNGEIDKLSGGKTL